MALLPRPIPSKRAADFAPSLAVHLDGLSLFGNVAHFPIFCYAGKRATVWSGSLPLGPADNLCTQSGATNVSNARFGLTRIHLTWRSRWIVRQPISEGLAALVLVTALAFAWSAEVVGGLAAITGAFIAGVGFGRSRLRQEIERPMHTITYAFLVPIFFVSIGLKTNALLLAGPDVAFALALVVVAMLSKVIGAGLGTRLGGLVVGLVVHYFIGEERHHGVAGIMEAVALGGGRLRYRRVPAKAVAAALSIGSGASVGPEDPSVQIGSNLGSMFGQWLHLSDERLRALVAYPDETLGVALRRMGVCLLWPVTILAT